jgi:hypothetical protein
MQHHEQVLILLLLQKLLLTLLLLTRVSGIHWVALSIVELPSLLYWDGLRTHAHFTSVPDFVMIAYSTPSAIFAFAFLLSMSTICTSSTGGTPLSLPAMRTQ